MAAWEERMTPRPPGEPVTRREALGTITMATAAMAFGCGSSPTAPSSTPDDPRGPVPAQEGSISITSPSPYSVTQRSRATQGSLTITGSFTGQPTGLEARFNGGAWAMIGVSPAGGTFVGTLANQPVGQGALEVRFANGPSVSASISMVGIGDVIAIWGQSNASGLGSTLARFSHRRSKPPATTTPAGANSPIRGTPRIRPQPDRGYHCWRRRSWPRVACPSDSSLHHQ